MNLLAREGVNKKKLAADTSRKAPTPPLHRGGKGEGVAGDFGGERGRVKDTIILDNTGGGGGKWG